MNKYFCGWYFKCQSENQTIAFIPAIHENHGKKTCSLQLITNKKAWNIPFSYSEFRKKRKAFSIHLGENLFCEKGIKLNLHTKDLDVSGILEFSKFTPIHYDIMGPFHYVPFMECRHSIISMFHTIYGKLQINGINYPFHTGSGYIEGDKGYSFPSQYLWTQCHFDEGSLMLSAAEIPLGFIHFTGIICVIIWHGKEYRLASYLGAKAEQIKNKSIQIRQGCYTLTAKLLETKSHSLAAPTNGCMTRTIRENPSCHATYCFQKNGQTLFSFETEHAAFEYEYSI